MELKVLESRPLADQPGPALVRAWLRGDERAAQMLGPAPSLGALRDRARAIELRHGSPACVVTGQQSHWLGGPAFVLLKIATARAVANALAGAGATPPAVWFWSHSDDADAGEVDHLHVVNQHFDVQRLSLGLQPDRRPLYARPLPENAPAVFAATFEALLDGPLKAPLAERLRPTLAAANLADHFASWLAATHPAGALRVIEPRSERAKCAKVVARFVRSYREVAERWRAVDRLCRDAAWDAPFDPWSTTPFFVLDAEQRRVPVRVVDAGDLWSIDGREISAAELAGKLENGLETAIPGALLRVVLQSCLLPVSAYVGGPSELAYQAYALCLFELFDQISPLLVPRLHSTFVSASSLPQIQRFGVRDLLAITHEQLVAALPEPTEDPRIRALLDELGETVRRVHAELAERAQGLDSSLARSLEQSGAQMGEQVEKTRARIAKVTQNRAGTGSRQARKLAHWIRPLGQAQERVLAATQLLARLGPELPDALVRASAPFEPSHRILCFEEP
ncbi:MAG: bacillithiol biosynthesis BshC [Planctomycetes bacterium]|nr:bacillithiol biosynthesis BshC [Planctomycetota bacterium]